MMSVISPLVRMIRAMAVGGAPLLVASMSHAATFAVTCGQAPAGYTVDGVLNRPVTVTRGEVAQFAIDASCSGHPFFIRTALNGSVYSTGVTNNGATGGIVALVVDSLTPASLAYQSGLFPAMGAQITVVDPPTATPTATASATATWTPTPTPTDTPTEMPTASPTESATPSPSATPTSTPTSTATETSTVTPTATPLPGTCAPSPLPGCKTPVPAKGKLSIGRTIGNPSKSKLAWSWKGQATSLGELGTPSTSTSYRVCVYDGSDVLLFDLGIPAGGLCGTKDCWKGSSKGFVYKNKATTPGGISAFSVRSGGDGKASVKMKANGANLSLPDLPLSTPVTVQVISDTHSTCFSATFTAPSTDPLSTTSWKAKND